MSYWKKAEKKLQKQLIMQDKEIHILCTRPLNAALIAEAKQKGFAIDVFSFIETEKIKSAAIELEINKAASKNIVAVFTSMNAVEAVTEILAGQHPRWSIFCMGNTTKKLVTEYFGEESISGTANDAAELAAKIAKDRFIDEVIFFCGDIRRDELPAILSKNNVEVKEMLVYSTTLTAQNIEKEYAGILFFSPSAVQSFFSTNVIPQTTTLFAIGKTTAEEINKYTTNTVIIGDEPGKENLLQKMMTYYHES